MSCLKQQKQRPRRPRGNSNDSTRHSFEVNSLTLSMLAALKNCAAFKAVPLAARALRRFRRKHAQRAITKRVLIVATWKTVTSVSAIRVDSCSKRTRAGAIVSSGSSARLSKVSFLSFVTTFWCGLS